MTGAWGVLISIVVLSVMPSPPSVDFESSDKVGHLLAYATLMGWFALLYPARRPRLAVSFVSLGVLLECVQGALGYRSLEFADMLANSLGVLLGWGVALGYGRLAR